MELARQSILIRELFDDFKAKNPVTDEAAKAEYDKFKAQATGTEYRARHILVEKEDEAKALIKQIKAGGQLRGTGQEALQGPGLRRQRRRPRLRQARRLRARIQQGHDALKKGEMTPEPGEEPVRLPHHPPRGHARGRSSRPSTKSRARSSSAWSRASCSSSRKSLRAKAKTDYKFAQ
jgi:peptidyl-prolyl cis-trans isomerase C